MALYQLDADNWGPLVPIGIPGGIVAFSLGDAAANYRVAISFRAYETGNMTAFRFLNQSNAGTPTSACRADLYACNADYTPNIGGGALATNSAAPITPTNASVNTVTWDAPYSTTEGTWYSAVMRNVVAANPEANFWRPGGRMDNSVINGYSDAMMFWSPDAGTTWVAAGPLLQFWATYATAGIVGPFHGREGSGAYSTIQMYNSAGTRRARIALEMTFPKTTLIHGIGVHFTNNTGTPAYSLKGEIFSGTDLVATTSQVIPSTLNLAVHPYGMIGFSSPVEVPAGTYRFAVTPVNDTAGDASNRMNPFKGDCVVPNVVRGIVRGAYYSTAAGDTPSWVADNSQMPHITVLAEPTAPAGGGGGARFF